MSDQDAQYTAGFIVLCVFAAILGSILGNAWFYAGIWAYHKLTYSEPKSEGYTIPDISLDDSRTYTGGMRVTWKADGASTCVVHHLTSHLPDEVFPGRNLIAIGSVTEEAIYLPASLTIRCLGHTPEWGILMPPITTVVLSVDEDGITQRSRRVKPGWGSTVG